MSENKGHTDQIPTNQIIDDHDRDSVVRDALLNLRQLGASLPEIDAEAVVRAGREADTRVN